MAGIMMSSSHKGMPSKPFAASPVADHVDVVYSSTFSMPSQFSAREKTFPRHVRPSNQRGVAGELRRRGALADREVMAS